MRESCLDQEVTSEFGGSCGNWTDDLRIKRQCPALLTRWISVQYLRGSSRKTQAKKLLSSLSLR